MVRAKKHLGQHFLKDLQVAHDIAHSIPPSLQSLPLIEVGPGKGVLTHHFLRHPHFHAIDLDEESITYLKNKYPEHADKFICADFLEYDLEALTHGPFNVIGNFPYNISSQIMFKVIEHKDSIRCVAGMFQKEVAERIAEKPGSKVYGILSVLLQAWYDIEYLFTVHEHVFDPPPKVKSGVIRLVRNNVTDLGCDEKLFKSVIKTAFNQRRKTIRNSIRGLLPAGAEHPLLQKRPEQLGVSEFIELTRLVSARK